MKNKRVADMYECAELDTLNELEFQVALGGEVAGPVHIELVTG